MPVNTSLSKTTSRTLPEREVARRVAAQLPAILLPADQRAPNPNAKKPLSSLVYDLSAQASDTEGICTQRYVWFDFTPVAADADADTDVHVSDLSTGLKIIALNKPGKYAGLDDAQQKKAEKLCREAGITPAYAVFRAEGAGPGIAALKAFEALQDALQRTVDFPIDCGNKNPADQGCRAGLAKLTPRAIDQVGGCGRDRAKPLYNVCWEVWAGDYTLRIFVNEKGVPQYALVDELVVMSHTRID
jgi:hypothetical protein